MATELQDTFKAVKEASKSLVLLSDAQRNEILQAVADAIDAHQAAILKANADDLLSRLQRAGYNPSMATADINGTTFYRVISATADSKGDAARSRDAIKGTQFNPKGDAWILAK